MNSTAGTSTGGSPGQPANRTVLAALTDVGRQRGDNQDAFLLWDLTRGKPIRDPAAGPTDGDGPYLVAVSDGMGGAASGEVASRTALDALAEYSLDSFRSHASEHGERFRRWLVRGLVEANRRVLARSQDDATLQGMGATLTAAILRSGTCTVGHVGDTRLYLLRGGRLRQLTMDHTHVQDLVAIGRISEQEARTHAHRNLLVQAVGRNDELEVDDIEVSTARGDRLLLCSDGLHGLVEDEEIQQVLSSPFPPSEQCRDLVDRANRRGGPDNITAIVAHLD